MREYKKCNELRKKPGVFTFSCIFQQNESLKNRVSCKKDDCIYDKDVYLKILYIKSHENFRENGVTVICNVSFKVLIAFFGLIPSLL